jgi:hypothetical protein
MPGVQTTVRHTLRLQSALTVFVFRVNWRDFSDEKVSGSTDEH